MAIVTLTRRTRSLGFGWSNDVEQRSSPSGASTYLMVREVTAPDVVGSLCKVEQEVAHACRVNSGNHWRGGWFVGARPIMRIIEPAIPWTKNITALLREEGRVVVEVED